MQSVSPPLLPSLDPAFQAFDGWAKAIDQHIGELEIHSDSRDSFAGRVCATPFGPGHLHRLENGEHFARRTRASIARCRSPAFYLFRVCHGSVRVSSPRGVIDVNPGDLALCDGKDEFSLASYSTTTSLAFRFPQSWLRRWTDTPEDLAWNRIDGSEGWGKVLSSAFENIELEQVHDLALPADVIAEQLAALLVLAATPPAASAMVRQPSLLRRIRQAMRDMHADMDLTPAGVATSVGISKRYLHRLLAINGTTYSEELSEIRLQQAKQLLMSRAHSAMSIQSVAFACGFSDPSYFARKFRGRFGTAPTVYRLGTASAN